MSPEFGSTCAIFPIDAETLRYLEFTGRPAEQVALVEAYAKEQGLWHDEHAEEPTFTSTLDARPRHASSRRSPGRGARRTACRCTASQEMFREELKGYVAERGRRRTRRTPRASPRATRPRARRPARPSRRSSPPRTARRSRRRRATAPRVPVTLADGTADELDHGHVVIAAITSCTNTSNPSVMLAAGLLARNARARGPDDASRGSRPRSRPGSKVVTDYLLRADLQDDLDALGFNLVGYGCTTCIGNSGPLPDEVSAAVNGARPRRSARCSRATATSRGASTPT